MNKHAALVIFSFVVLTACEPKPTESSSVEHKDTIKREAQAVAAPEVELSGKAAAIATSWKADEVITPTAKLPGNLIEIKFDFRKDGTFEYTQDGKKEGGKWKMNEEETMITLEYTGGRKADYDIKELGEGKLTIAGKEHDMYRTLKLSSAN